MYYFVRECVEFYAVDHLVYQNVFYKLMSNNIATNTFLQKLNINQKLTEKVTRNMDPTSEISLNFNWYQERTSLFAKKYFPKEEQRF